MIIIKKKYHFYAAHRNHEGGAKCGRIHGHTYKVVCHIEAEQKQDSSLSILFSDIDLIIDPIVKSFCHWFLLHDRDVLCDVLDAANEPYKKLPFVASAENMAKHLFELIKEALPIIKIELQETESSTIVYEP